MSPLWQVKLLAARALGKTKLKRLAPAVYLSSLNAAPEAQKAEIHYRLSHAYSKAARDEEALEHLRVAVKLNPEVSYWKYKLGATQLKLGDSRSALETFESMIEADPTVHLATYGKARALARMNDVAGAMNTLRMALQASPNSKKYHTLMVKLARRTGQQPLVRAVLEEALSLAGDDRAWISSLVEIYDRIGEYEKILDILSDRSEDEQTDHDVLFWEGRALEQLGRREEAEAKLLSAVELLPPEAKILGPGYFYQRRRQFPEAISWFKKTLRENGSVPEVHYQLGRCFEAEYDWEAAESEFELACSAPGAKAHWHGHRGIAREQLGKLTGACAAYRRASQLEDHPNNSWAYRLARTLASSGRASESLPVVQQACAASPQELSQLLSKERKKKNSTPSVFRLFESHARNGLRLLESGDFGGAADEFELAVLRNSSHWPSLYMSWAFALTKAGAAVDAATAYARSRMVQSSFIHDARGLLKTRDSQQRIYYSEFQQDYAIDENAILYESGAGITMACNPMAIFRELLGREEYADYRHFWAVNKDETVPEHLRNDPRVFIVRRNSHLYLKVLASAKYLINNNTFPPLFSRRSEQKYLNTWHGVPLKTLGVDIQNGQMDHRNAARNLLHATHVLIPNEHTGRVLLERYDIQGLFTGKTARIGYPRIDNVIAPRSEVSDAIRRRLGLSDSKRTLLYAPTWRGDLKGAVIDETKIKSDLEKLESTGYKVLFRGHTMVESILSKSSLADSLVPADIDTNDLLAVVDILVTDYSSIFFDFIPTGKPIFYYAYDLEAYKQERGMYFDLYDMPGEVCLDIESLVSGIGQLQTLNFRGRADYVRSMNEFCPQEDGGATSRAIDFLFHDRHVDQSAEKAEGKSNALFYQGSFIPNGITASFRNLVANLDLDRVRPVVVVLPAAVFSRPERIAELRAVAERVQLLGVVGGHLATLEERLVLADFNADLEWRSERKQVLFHRAYEREFHRLFGSAQFDAAISFEGFQRHFTALMSAAPKCRSGRTVMLHSAMKRERDTRFSQLKAIFNLYPQFDHLVSVSKSVNEVNREDIKAEIDIPVDRFDFAENLLDIDSIRLGGAGPLDDGIRDWMSGADYTFINVARLSPEKDHAKLIRALASARQRSRLDLRLLLVGDGPTRSVLESLRESLDLGSAVLFAGRQDNPYPMIKAADCFAFSSNYEGQGIAVLESLVLETPVVSTDVVGPRSILEGGYGMLVDNNEEGLATGLVKQAAERTVYRQFDADSYNAEALRKFNEIVLGF